MYGLKLEKLKRIVKLYFACYTYTENLTDKLIINVNKFATRLKEYVGKLLYLTLQIKVIDTIVFTNFVSEGILPELNGMIPELNDNVLIVNIIIRVVLPPLNFDFLDFLLIATSVSLITI